jgi:hypothetical protein
MRLVPLVPALVSFVAALAACYREPAGPCVAASPPGSGLTPPSQSQSQSPSPSPPTSAIEPSPAVAIPPPAACPPPAPPSAAPKAGVSIEALLQGLPSFEPAAPKHRDGSDPHGARDALRNVDPDNLDQIVPAVRAVIAEPGNVQARFILACTLAQHRLHTYARLELTRLADAKRCPSCVDALVNVTDPFCSFDDQAKAIAAAAKPTPVRTAAERILESINSGDPSQIIGYLEGTSALVHECSVCDEPMSTRTPMSRDQLVTFVRGAEKRYEEGPHIYVRPFLLFCDDRCCTGPHSWLTHSSHTVTSICFRGAASAPKLDFISALSG